MYKYIYICGNKIVMLEKVSKYILFLLVGILAGCSTTKVIPNGESRLKKNEIKILNSKSYQASDLEPYVKQKPNTYFFWGWNPFINIYNWQNGKDKGWDRFVEKIGQAPVVFDLYSGTGTIAQLMAPVAGKVIGVEIVEEAVEAAKKNAQLNGLDNCDFIAGDVLKVLDEIEEKPDMIILDPPRDGIHPKALPKIIDYGVDRIVYISCKPTSLVRDLEVFLKSGYEVEKAVAVDQFPWTANCETVCLLERMGNHK